MKKLAEFILSVPKTIFACIVILALASIYPASQVKTDFNLEGFFPKNDETITEYEQFTDEFGRDDNVILIGLEDDSIFTRQKLFDIKAITDSVKTIDKVMEVNSLWTAQKMRKESNSLTFEPYLTNQVIQNRKLDSLKKQLIDDDLIGDVLLSQSGTITAISIEIDDSENAYTTRQRILEQIYEIIEPYQSNFKIRYSGIPYFRNMYVNLLNGEIIFFVVLSSVLILVILWFLYRSISGLVIPIIIVWLTVLYTVAIVVLTGGFFEILSSTIAPILLCVGVADSIHMISKYEDSLRAGLPKPKAVMEMLTTLGSATLLTSITTALGFATLISSNVTPMKRFGLYTAIGVMIAYIVTIALLPSSITTLPIKNILNSGKNRMYTWGEKKLRELDSFNRRNYVSIVITVIIIVAVVGGGALKMTINSRVFDDLGRDTEVIQNSNYLSENLTPPFPMEFVINTGEVDGIKNPDLLHQIEDFKSYLYQFPSIQRVTSLNTILKKLHEQMAPGSNTKLPASRPLIAQYLLLLEFNKSDLLENYVDFDYQKTRISARMFDNGSKTTNAIRDSVQQYLHAHFPDDEVTITGTTILVADLTDNIVYSLSTSILLAFLAISLIMAFLFRNLKLVIIALVPNIMPLLITAGVMGYLNIFIKPSTAVIFTIAFGIVVDDSIHYLARYRVESLRGASMIKALRISTIKTGKAMVITSIILITGFGTLAFSQFNSTMLMGLLICLTIVTALIADLIFLPALFYWLKPDLNLQRKNARKIETESTRDQIPVSESA